MSPSRPRPPGIGARPRALGSGFRLRRDLSLAADAQRRYRAVAARDEAIGELQSHAAGPSPNPLPRPGEAIASVPAGRKPAVTRVTMFGASETSNGNVDEANLTALTLQARTLYEGGVVQVRAVARLCDVSVRTLYNYVHKYVWRRRRPDRDPAGPKRERRRPVSLAKMRGLKARDPAGQAQALAVCGRAAAISDLALARALARRDAEADARIFALVVRAMRDLAAIKGAVSAEDNPADPLRKHDTDPSPQQIAKRIKLLVDDEAGRASRPQPAPPPEPEDDEPLTEQDRRINAIAERFYARREGN